MKPFAQPQHSAVPVQAPAVAPIKPDDVEAPTELVSLSLDQAIKLANDRSFRTARSRRNMEMSELRFRNAKSGYYPRASAALSADQSARSYSYATDQFNFNQPNQGEFRGGPNLDVSMPLDFAGVIKRQVRQAKMSQDMSAAELDQSTLDLTLEAQNNYLNALRAQNTVDADERVVAEIQRLLESSRTSAPGAAPFLEVELANAQQSLTSSKENADRAQDGLKQTLRVPPETRLRLTTRFTDRKELFERKELLQKALNGRPDVQQAYLRIRQAEVSLRQVNDQRLPSVRLGGFYSNQFSSRSVLDVIGGNPDRFKSQGFGLNMNVPVVQFDNGQLGRQKRIAAIQVEQAQADAEELRERVGYELRQALLGVERAENRLENLPDRKQAYDALKRAEEQMLSAPEGQAQALLAQVSNSRNAWRSAETASADAFIDYNNAVFRLQRTIGERSHVDEMISDPLIAAAPVMSAVLK
jgi:outer membrane protein TolC